MFWRVRSFWAAAGATSYVLFAAISAAGTDLRLLVAALVALPALLAAVWTLSAPPSRGEDRVDPGARAAARACATGVAIVGASLAGPEGPGFTVFANLGAGLCAMAALVALARLESLGGLLPPPPGARRLDTAAFAALLWSVAVGVPGARVLWPERMTALPRLADETASVAAAVGSLLLLVGAAARVRVARRLELGVSDRAGASLWLSVVALFLGVAAGGLNVLPAGQGMPLALVAASAVTAWAAVSVEATTVARALRTALSVLALTAPIALGGVAAAQLFPARGAMVLFAAAWLAAAAGLVAPLLARRLAPASERWLVAFEAATRAAMNPDPDQALEDALGHLRHSSGKKFATPSLYRVGPGDVMTVDRAGFVHTETAELPTRLLDLADEEPEGILRAEVLRALEVRRPDLRSLGVWLEERSIAAGAVIRDATGPIGVLAIARGTRSSPMTLEEVRALRRLADRLGAVLGVAASLARSRQRETLAEREVDRARLDLRIVEERFEMAGRRARALAEALSRPARVASYGPAARALREELGRLAQSGKPIALLAAPGVDPIPWLSLYHLESSRADGPIVFVQGTEKSLHEVASWRDPKTSPISLSAGGTLCLLDPQALPVPVLRYLGAALPREIGVTLVLPATVDAMVARGQLEERFADRVGDRSVSLPTLAQRGEDLRGLALEHLTLIGLRLRGEPMGLAESALALLGDHTWPGNDAELQAVLIRAALVAAGPTIDATDLSASGFSPLAAPRRSHRAALSPIPQPKRRRGAARASGKG